MADETVNPKRAFSCEVLSFAPRKFAAENARFWCGEITLKSTLTLVEKTVCFAVLRQGAGRFTCAADEHAGQDTQAWFNEWENLFNAQKYDELHESVIAHLPHQYPVYGMINDVRQKVMQTTFRKMDAQTDESFARLFEAQYPVVRALQNIGAPVPKAFLTVAERVLAADVKDEIRAADINIGALEELMEDVKALGLKIAPHVNGVMTDKVTNLAFAFAREPQSTHAAVKLVELLNYAEIFGFSPDIIKAQEFVFLGLTQLGQEAGHRDILRALARKLKIAL